MHFLRPATKFAVSVGIVTLIYSGLNGLSIFGFHDATAAFSRDLVARIMAPAYPARGAPASAVVLIDDRSDVLEDTYPLKLGTHAHVLEALLEHHPKAVYVDFAFFDARPDDTIDRFKLTVRRYRERGVPLYVAAYTPAVRPERGPIRPELRDLVASGDIRLVSFALGPTIWGIPTYALRDEEQKLPTVVGRMIDDLLPESRPLLGGDNLMEIAWALPPSPFNCRRAGGCGWFEYTRLGRALAGLKLNGFTQWAAPIQDPVRIPYVPSVAAGEVLDGDAAETITPVLAGKVVFYGPNFDVARDAIPNPVFTYADERGVLPGRQVPGAFVHAMAFENAKDLGIHVKRPRALDDQRQWWSDFLLILILAPVFLVSGWASRRAVGIAESKLPPRKGPISAARGAAIRAAASLGVVLPAIATAFIAWCQYALFDLAPSNWCGIFLLLTVSSVLKWDLRMSNLIENGADRLARWDAKRKERADALA